jgi:hypothetical protein
VGAGAPALQRHDDRCRTCRPGIVQQGISIDSRRDLAIRCRRFMVPAGSDQKALTDPPCLPADGPQQTIREGAF